MIHDYDEENEIEITANVQAFGDEPARDQTVLVSPCGTVRVFDEICGHFSTCHSLSRADEIKIRHQAWDCA